MGARWGRIFESEWAYRERVLERKHVPGSARDVEVRAAMERGIIDGPLARTTTIQS